MTQEEQQIKDNEKYVNEIIQQYKNKNINSQENKEKLAFILKRISDLMKYFVVYSRRNFKIEEETFNELKQILIDIYKQPKFFDTEGNTYCNLKTLVKQSPKCLRHIDFIYLASCLLNGQNNSVDDYDYLKYLYIINLTHKNTLFIEWLERKHKNIAIDAIKEFNQCFLAEYLPEIQEPITELIDYTNKQNPKFFWNNFYYLRPDINQLIDYLLYKFNLKIKPDTLNKIEQLADLNKPNQDLIHALKNFHDSNIQAFDQKMVVKLYLLISDRGESKDFLKNLYSDDKVKFIHYAFYAFNTEKSIMPMFGSKKNSIMLCSDFLRQHAVDALSDYELEYLLIRHNKANNIWKNRMLHKQKANKDLLRSIAHNNIEGVKQAIKDGANVNCPNGLSGSRLHEAIRCERIEMYDILLDHGADINATNRRGDTMLHDAAYIRNPATDRYITDMLLCGANLWAKNNEGKTPYDVAVHKGNGTKILLLEYYMKKNTKEGKKITIKYKNYIYTDENNNSITAEELKRFSKLILKKQISTIDDFKHLSSILKSNGYKNSNITIEQLKGENYHINILLEEPVVSLEVNVTSEKGE